MNLKVKDVKVHVIAQQVSTPFISNGKCYLGVLRVISEEGLEGHSFVGNPQTDNTHSITPLAEVVKPFLVGRNAADRELIWHELQHWAHGWGVSDATVMAVDVALWDLTAKAADLPIYKMLGVYKHKAPAYASALYIGDLEANVEDAVAARERGYHGYKIHHAVPDVNRAAEVCERIREGVGDEMALAFDSGCEYGFREALYLGRALDELDFAWYEDPVDPTDMVSLAELSRRLETPIAMSDRPEFRLSQAPIAIEQKAARILIGEPSKDGITGIKKLATLCEAHHLMVSLHNGGNSLLNVANLHAMLSGGNFNMFPLLIPPEDYSFGLVEDLEMDAEGYVHGPEAPGLGVDIDWAALEPLTEAIL